MNRYKLLLLATVFPSMIFACGDPSFPNPSATTPPPVSLTATPTPSQISLTATPIKATIFEDGLPIQLAETCRSYFETEALGEASYLLGYTKANAYLEMHPNDARALYLRALGAAALIDLDRASEDYEVALRVGLPRQQADLAEAMLEAFALIQPGAEFNTVIETYFEALGNVLRDLEAICPDSEVPEQEEAKGPSERFGYRDALSQLLTPTGIDMTAMGELKYFPYEHLEDVKEVSEGILEAALDLQDQGQHHIVPTLINLNINILINNISAWQQEGQEIEALRGVEILMDSLLDFDSPIFSIVLGASRTELHYSLQYHLGNGEGEHAFQSIGRIIVENLDTIQAQELWNRLTPAERALLTGEEPDYQTLGFGECIAAAPRGLPTYEGIRADGCVREIIKLVEDNEITVEDVELAILLGQEIFPPNSAQAEKEVFPPYNHFLNNLVNILEDLAQDPRWADVIEGVVDNLVNTIECQVLEDCTTGRDADIIEARNAATALGDMIEKRVLREMVSQSSHRLTALVEKFEESELSALDTEELDIYDNIRFFLKRINE